MTYKLFIDDERFPVGDDWIIVRSSADAIKTVQERGLPSFISFDHDLGGEDTSRVFIIWLIDYLLDTDSSFQPGFNFYAHTQNPIGRDWINSTMRGVVTEFTD